MLQKYFIFIWKNGNQNLDYRWNSGEKLGIFLVSSFIHLTVRNILRKYFAFLWWIHRWAFWTLPNFGKIFWIPHNAVHSCWLWAVFIIFNLFQCMLWRGILTPYLLMIMFVLMGIQKQKLKVKYVTWHKKTHLLSGKSVNMNDSLKFSKIFLHLHDKNIAIFAQKHYCLFYWRRIIATVWARRALGHIRYLLLAIGLERGTI